MEESIVDILKYMRQHIYEEKTIKEIAAEFGYSKFHFSRRFKKLTGFSAADYLSSIKIEEAKKQILKSGGSITDSGFANGFSSLGSFSTIFKQKTGLSPRQYKKDLPVLVKLFQKAQETEDYYLEYNELATQQNHHRVTITVHYSEGNEPGMLFIGLFRSAIPNHRPVAGIALRKRNRYTFSSVPAGTYFALACGIKKSSNPINYFILDKCLRGKAELAIKIPSSKEQHIEIDLREPMEGDPPILLNLPQLLKDSSKVSNP